VTKRDAIRTISIVPAFFIYFIRKVFMKMAREISREGFNIIRLKQEEIVVSRVTFYFYFL
jgi:hypothetical protein